MCAFVCVCVCLCVCVCVCVTFASLAGSSSGHGWSSSLCAYWVSPGAVYGAEVTPERASARMEPTWMHVCTWILSQKLIKKRKKESTHQYQSLCIYACTRGSVARLSYSLTCRRGLATDKGNWKQDFCTTSKTGWSRRSSQPAPGRTCVFFFPFTCCIQSWAPLLVSWCQMLWAESVNATARTLLFTSISLWFICQEAQFALVTFTGC